MKKLFLILVILFPLFVKAQYTQIIGGPTLPGNNYVYVGSLSLAADDAGNCQKLKVDVFGGSWFSDSNGETSFYISNRGGLKVNQVTVGSSNGINRFNLKAFQNGGNLNFYLAPLASDFSSFGVKAFFIGGLTLPAQNVTITTSATTPSGTDISASLAISPVMITDGSGNMGLNTFLPDPAYKLSVNGKMRAKEIRVETGWADDVFNSGYPLVSLATVKAYIDQHHHLPEIPSAQEISKNGLQVGEMNKLLMKKVEELTLYLIEMKAEIKELQKQNESLKKF
jgi:hypothetical protein